MDGGEQGQETEGDGRATWESEVGAALGPGGVQDIAPHGQEHGDRRADRKQIVHLLRPGFQVEHQLAL
jgi:hypothetical protein